MKKLKVLLTGLVLTGLLLQHEDTWASSPKDVVDRFVQLDVNGARLTAQGWKQADVLFTKHAGPFQPTFIVVIASRYAVSQDASRKDYFLLGYDDVGHIDTPTLKFTPTRVSAVRWWYEGYTVRLATGAQNGNDSAGWKIEGYQPTEMHLTAAAARRWVMQVRDKTPDIAVHKNADQTLAELKLYQ